MVCYSQDTEARPGSHVYVKVQVRRSETSWHQDVFVLAEIIGENKKRRDGVEEWDVVLVASDNTCLLVPKTEVYKKELR